MKHFVSVLVLFLLPSVAFGQVVINEIAWMGSSVDGVDSRNWWRYEWVELYNTTEASISLEGWVIELAREKLDFRIPLKGTIEPKGYFLIAASDKIVNFDLNYSNLAGKFVNSGQKIVLKDASGKVMEEIDARQRWFAGDNKEKLSMARKDPAISGNDPANWANSLNPDGTPKAPNNFSKETLALDKEKEPFNLSQAIQNQKLKKDLAGSFRDSIAFVNFRPLFIALLVALSCLIGILGVKRYLSRPG